MIPSHRRRRRIDVSNAARPSVAPSEHQSELLLVSYIRALRPRQWTKNLIVFAAPLFAFNITVTSLLNGFLAFALFCCASSSFYLINDLIDVESDRRHPIKCKRPIASGAVSVAAAIALAATLLGFALLAGWWKAYGLGAAILGYALLQVAYNIKLKHKVIVDVVAIAAGFIFRALGGAAATGITLSHWFLLCTAMLALFLGIEKRKAELRLSEISGKKSRKVLDRYSLPLLSRMESVVTNGTIITYALWSSGPAVNGASTPWMMLTIPFVLYGVFRYQLLSDPEEISRKNTGLEAGGETERPEEILLGDKPLLFSVLSWISVIFIILSLESRGIIQ
ncbi:decaprenyl-phosphate phosphoribosyltransferase [Nodosilinea sp. LEGE 07088]|uniref:decaprenyl-phosphate phosphoribosyltransferase n=1 Tax=Nodosilinea sp. LEGE 07088 TaxID=2777968 RepID=UPI00187FC377|nr:decaprenyl-phosphate phosphoribosyltransferase [Nodosilinea sp. LEGE 07088]MBE9136854.1 decaprenyl-phosphate phosphoribosyltransferase [Nodosilinea sp. LEGE 07088]